MEASDELMVTWSNHRPTLLNEVAQLRHQACYSDVSLACEGRLYLVHKFVLAMCSDYFRNIFGSASVSGNNSNLVIVLKDVACQDVEQLLDYMYTGVVAVERSCLQSLIKTAENLQIKGLAIPDQMLVDQHHVRQTDRDAGDQYSQDQHGGHETGTDDRSSLGDGDSVYDEEIPHTGANRRLLPENLHLDVRLSNRDGNNTNRHSNAYKDLHSPPSKRKRVHEYGLLASSSSHVQSPRKVSSPILHHMFASSQSSPTVQSSAQSASPVMSSHQHGRTMSSGGGAPKPLQDLHSTGGSPSYIAPTRHGGVSSSPHHLAGSAGHSFSTAGAPGLAALATAKPESGSLGAPLAPHPAAAAVLDSTGSALPPRPEDVEIKQELPDVGDVCDGAASSSSAVGGRPLVGASHNKDSTKLKEEPPADDGEPGPSREPQPGEECWTGGAVAGGGASLLPEEDAGSDTDNHGIQWRSSDLFPNDFDVFTHASAIMFCNSALGNNEENDSSSGTHRRDSVSNQSKYSEPDPLGLTAVPSPQILILDNGAYSCPYCSLQTRHKNDMRKHVRTHTGEKPFSCPYCSHTAARKDSMERHLMSHAKKDGQPVVAQRLDDSS